MDPETLIAWFWGIARHRCTAVLLSDRDPDATISDRCQQVGAEYVFSHLPPISSSLERHPIDEKRIAVILFTSGSTNTPKAVAHSLHSLKQGALASNQNIPLDTRDIWLLSLSLWHIGGLAIMLRTLYAGAQLSYPCPTRSLGQQIALEAITHISLVATQLYRLLQENKSFPSLKAILVGGGPIPETLIEESLHLPIHTTYGMTELGSQLCTTPSSADVEMRKTAGYPLAGWELNIDPQGQIWARGSALFLGYVNQQQLINKCNNKGFFPTGDTGKLTPEGNLIVLGRCDQMFISGGENIHPEEIEKQLCTLSAVEAALVIPIAHEEYGMRPVAFIKGNVRVHALQQMIQKTLPRFKHPDAYFVWPECLPTQKPSRQQAQALLPSAIPLS